MSDTEWFCAIDGKPIGPVAESQVKSMFEEGQVNENTLFWTKEISEWLPASEIVTFETYRQESPPPTTNNT